MRYNCIDPAQAYRYSTTDTFIAQMFDAVVIRYSSDDDLIDSYDRCLDGQPGGCTQEDVTSLQEFWNNFTTGLDSYPQKQSAGNSGFVSTCTKHVFYKDNDLFTTYANTADGGVTVGDAVSKWWNQYDSTNDWHLPCALGSPQQVQCEPSCDKISTDISDEP